MKTKILNFVALFLVVVLSLANMFVAPMNVNIEATEPTEEVKVATVLNNNENKIDTDKVLEARFLNMLNHNFVYGDDFKSVEAIVNDSVLALLNLRDSEKDGYIAETYVKDYVFNMYGIEIESFADINSDFEQIEGYVYILPRGYSVLEHKISSVIKNEDGSYTVKTIVTEASHDGSQFIDECETLFVENTASQFGFSIIRSVIGAKALTI